MSGATSLPQVASVTLDFMSEFIQQDSMFTCTAAGKKCEDKCCVCNRKTCLCKCESCRKGVKSCKCKCPGCTRVVAECNCDDSDEESDIEISIDVGDGMQISMPMWVLNPM